MVSQDLSQLRQRIDGVLADFTKVRSAALTEIGSELQPVASAMSEFITEGGKRFRPIFAYLGYPIKNRVLTDTIRQSLKD